uniref:Uncharacterized protein n=1 Tax=Anopheles atroparvus TaxID=41427 RepID=A0AAG5DIB8_ANOAO
LQIKSTPVKKVSYTNNLIKKRDEIRSNKDAHHSSVNLHPKPTTIPTNTNGTNTARHTRKQLKSKQ